MASSTWLSAGIGPAVIRLRTDHRDWLAHYQTVYIGVYGRVASAYTLTVSIVEVEGALRGRGYL